ncbi:MAG: NAD(P)-binding domain-containing protein, partial [Clostridia bacterium]|nr:NAD(P)-binding domain-containing protein [Clostridia bacterium]
MKIFVIGAGRWGSFIAWYLDKIGHSVSLYGRESSKKMQELIATGKNDVITFPKSIALTTSLDGISDADVIVISIDSQGLSSLMDTLADKNIENKVFVLCMKGIEIGSGKRLSEIVSEKTSKTNTVAVWLGPGHVQEFYSGRPNCMVIDSNDEKTKRTLVDSFSSDLIRFYYGTDLIGNEIGAAAKNVIGIAAGMLDGFDLSSLKGALMARGPREISRLVEKLGGNPVSVYGLCHLGDYEATVFSKYSHNRAFGENLVRGVSFDALAEGYYT